MKSVAAGFLLFAAVVYLVALRAEHHGGAAWVGYIRAAAEAGMVGGLADWFAVTALFRHPLGIPIPHTAIIPQRKDAIGASLGSFVSENFLSEDVIRTKLSSLDLGKMLGEFLSVESNAQKVTKEISGVIHWLDELGDDEQISQLIDDTFKRLVNKFDVSGPLAALLETSLEHNAHQPVIDLLAGALEDHLRSDPQRAQGWFNEQLPRWIPGVGKDLAGEWIYNRIIEWCTDVRADVDHPLRDSISRWLAKYAKRMRTNRALKARINEIKMSLANNPQIKAAISDMWLSAKETLARDSQNPDSPLRIRTTQMLVTAGNSLLDDEKMRNAVDETIADLASHVVNNYRNDITGIITDTVARWDADDTSRKIELQVGRDLQYIRLNGTLVGALAGAAIYAVGQLVVS